MRLPCNSCHRPHTASPLSIPLSCPARTPIPLRSARISHNALHTQVVPRPAPAASPQHAAQVCVPSAQLRQPLAVISWYQSGTFLQGHISGCMRSMTRAHPALSLGLRALLVPTPPPQSFVLSSPYSAKSSMSDSPWLKRMVGLVSSMDKGFWLGNCTEGVRGATFVSRSVVWTEQSARGVHCVADWGWSRIRCMCGPQQWPQWQ